MIVNCPLNDLNHDFLELILGEGWLYAGAFSRFDQAVNVLLEVDEFVIFEVEDVEHAMCTRGSSIIYRQQHQSLVCGYCIGVGVVEPEISMLAVAVGRFEVAQHFCLAGDSDHNYFCWNAINQKSMRKGGRQLAQPAQRTGKRKPFLSERIAEAKGKGCYRFMIYSLWGFGDIQVKDLMTDQQQFKLLIEAEGELNSEVQAALSRFRSTMLESMSPFKKESVAKSSDYNKQGPEKRFLFRESLLSVMFEIRDFRTIYNMVVASFVILTLELFYDNYVRKGEILDMNAFFHFFRGAKTTILAWLTLSVLFFCIIFVTKFALATKVYVWLPLYGCYIVGITSVAIKFAKSDDLGFASVIIIMAELARMVMKSHSYFRTKLLYIKDNPYKQFEFRGIRVENVRGLKEDEAREEKLLHISIKWEDTFREMQKLGFFFFAPTLVYRDHYILTPVRSFSKAAAHLINFLACVYYSFILYQNWCKPAIEQLEERLDFQSLSSAVINLMLPSVLFLIMGFFGFLHSWLNLWAEITRFPDRAFYADWWNSIEFGSYYRKWNIVVHDWLYYYVYLDIYRFAPGLRKGRAVAQLFTFVISAIIHECIIYYAIGFFYPILFILFAGPGILFMQIASLRKTSVNLIFWLEMYIGSSIMFTLYLVECFARQKVSDQFVEAHWGTLSFLIPRTLYLGQ